MASLPVEVRPLEAADASECDAIVASLPYHFGDAGGRALCARAVREQPGYAASGDGGVVGFLTWRAWFEDAIEITWMAVHTRRRRQGVGARLVEALVGDAPAAVRYLLVTTLSEATPEPERDDTYEGTRRFYRRLGFTPIWEPEGWWNSRNQALLLVRALDHRPD